MADGYSRTKRKTMMSYAEEADPRFMDNVDREDDGKNRKKGRKKKGRRQPSIAFTGEEWGFGYQATRKFVVGARSKKVPEAGLEGVTGARLERDLESFEASDNNKFDFADPVSKPLRTKEQALMAVKQDTADFAVIPFYSPYAGYDFESLRCMASLSAMMGVELVEATDKLCLAVHESQLYDIIQSAHPGTGFSALQRRLRKSWGLVDSGSGNMPGADYEGEMPRAGLPIDMSDQKLIRDRIDVVFAGPEAARRSKSKLDGLRAIGVEVQEIPEMVEPHRELAKRARASTDNSRQINTSYDPVSGETRFFSSLGAQSQTNRLYGMILPYEVAMRSSDYIIIDHDLDDAPAPKTRFMVVEKNPDHTLSEDKYRTTDAKTRYWVRRMMTVALPDGSLGAAMMQFIGYSLGALAALMFIIGFYGLTSVTPLVEAPASLSWLSSITSSGAILLSALIAFFAWTFIAVEGSGRRGVRALFKFRRDGTAASIGDVEDYLRNFGVRHMVTRIDEDSEGDKPASMLLDVEFDKHDFAYGPLAMFNRRLRGSVVNGALKTMFQRWKNRGVTIMAVMPYDEPQLPKHKARRWWKEAVGARLAEFTETWFIRLSRMLFVYLIPMGVVAYLVWRYMLGN
ncbi:MAG: hypothetical protein AAGC77_07595 [Pseudomonadota bacterium]